MVEEQKFGSDDEANEEVKEDSKKANQFAFIERASQTKQFDIQDAECQTDPPPMLVDLGICHILVISYLLQSCVLRHSQSIHPS